MKIKLDESLKNIASAHESKKDATDNVDKKKNKGFEKFLEEVQVSRQGFEVEEIKQYKEIIQCLLKDSETAEPKAARKDAIHLLERLFATLSIYRNALSNDKIDFRKLLPVIEDMNKEKDEMVVKMLELPEGDSLREIMAGAAVLIFNETNKYFKLYMY